MLVGDSTKCVHGSEEPDRFLGSVTTPIYQTTTFAYRDATKLANAAIGKTDSYVYTRWSNPTVEVLERKLALLECTDDSAFFASGMAAISTSLLSFLKKGDKLLAIRDLYGETYRLIREFLPSIGVNVVFVDTTDMKSIEEEVKKGVKVVYVETPTNPTMKLVDIKSISGLCKENNALLFIDNTFASPINQKPIFLGADLVLHSATKYLNGHADVVAGAVAGKKERVARIKKLRRTLGGTIDPHSAWLVIRGMKTMAIRVKKQNENALKLAEFLESSNKVSKVYYPGLKSHPQHELAKRQMSGFGGMLSFEISGSKEDAMRFTQSLKIAYLASSLGGVETLVSQPALLTHTQLSEEEKRKTGIKENLVRVSVGIEDTDDLLSDFANALSAL